MVPIELSPALFLSIWAAGLALVAAAVVWWRVVGPGFTWLAGAVTVLIGGAGWAAGASWPAGVGAAGAVAAVALGRRRAAAAPLLAVAAVAFGVASLQGGSVLGTLTGGALLGGITGEMLLGHWYLIDPTLPRWALKRLAAVGALGVVADGVGLGLEPAFDWAGNVTDWAFVVLAATTLVLMVAVWFALNEPSYPGVMAATGLSYLAILTGIGAAVSGRALVDEGSSLLAGAAAALGTLAVL